MRNKILLSCLVAVAFWILYNASNTPDGVVREKELLKLDGSSNFSRPPKQFSATDANSSIPSSPNAWQEMDSLYRKATSYREFFYKAIKMPEKGGYFYAMKIVGECGSIASKANDTSDAVVSQAMMVLRARCDFNDADKEDGFRQFEAMRNLNYRDDPLLKQMLDAVSANTDGERELVLQKALESGNPDVISSFVNDKVEKMVSNIFGSDAAHVEEYRQYMLDLLTCRLGDSCGAESTRNLVLCAENKWCGSNVSESIRNGNKQDFAILDNLAAQLANAITQKNYAALAE